MKIVVAEDDVLYREGLCALLGLLGHEILAAVSDRQGLEYTVQQVAEPDRLIDLVITDVRMPPSHSDDGLAGALAIRAIVPTIPILVLSQYIGDVYAIRLLTERGRVGGGGTGYLLKDRIGRTDEFLRAIQVVADGGVVVDPKVVAALMTARKGSSLESLSPRERVVMKLLAAGRTNDQIASELRITPTAVVKHVGSIFSKLGLQPADGNRRVLAVLEYLRSR